MAKYEIRKGVPLPAEKSKAGPTAKYPFADMVAGDCFIAPTPEGVPPAQRQRRLAAHAAHVGRKTGKKFTTRQLPDGSVGVWCVEVLPSHPPVSKPPKSMLRAQLRASLAQPVEA